MTVWGLDAAERAVLGAEMYELMRELYPLPRSITGDGTRETLRRLGKWLPLTIHEVPSGTRVLDWTVPREWNIHDAYVMNASGERVIDFQASNLHVVSGSIPVKARMTLAELRPHLHSLPERPEWIPYRTTHYTETWGFCVAHRRLAELEDGDYEVLIDASLEDGHLSYGEYRLEGQTTDEVLISCHVCHPSLANDNLSGVALAAMLARRLREARPRYCYRFLFIPGTIGSITWLAMNEAAVARIAHGLVVTCVGDAGPFTYKKSRRGDAEIDRAVHHVLRHSGAPHRIVDFVPWGYDERQYCSPGFDLPVGVLSRSPHGEFPEYHTSADDLGFVGGRHLGESLALYLTVLGVLEGNRRYVNTNPKGEPQLGRRGLYRAMGGPALGPSPELAMLWTLNLSDGSHTLLDIAERSALPFETVDAVTASLLGHGLLADPEDGS